jgi:hypothetical protein
MKKKHKQFDFLAQIRAHAKATGRTMTGLFTAAGVAYSNWNRWNNGETQPSTRILTKLLAVKRA